MIDRTLPGELVEAAPEGVPPSELATDQAPSRSSPLRRNYAANLIGRVATALLWIAITPYVLHRLGAERFGVWALFFAVGGYLTTFDLGIGDTMIRFIAVERVSGDRRGLERTLGRGFRLALGLGVCWALLVILTRSWIAQAFHVPAAMRTETLGALLVFAIGVLFMLPVQVLTGSLRGFERLDLANICTILGVLAHVSALFLGLSAGGGLRAVAAAGVIGQAVTGMLAAILLRREMARVRGGAASAGPSWRDLLDFGAALQITNSLAIVQLQIGKIILGLLGNLTMVADYELAFRVASGVAGLPVLMLGAAVPTATRVWESEGGSALSSLFTSILRWLYTQSVVTLGALWILAPDLTRLWLGPGHERVAGMIRLWTIGYAVNLAWSLGAAIARGIGKPWIEVWSLAASVLVNAALALWAIPRFGTSGAVSALAISYVAGFVTFVFLSRRSRLPFGPWMSRELVPRAAASVATVGACAWLLDAASRKVLLPPLGWAHGAIAGALFLVAFSILFLPFGDPQRLWRGALGVLSRGRTLRAS